MLFSVFTATNKVGSLASNLPAQRALPVCLPVNIPDKVSLSRQIEQRFKSGQGFALATLNLDHLVKLSSSARFRETYGRQDLVVADGNPIVWLSKLAGRPVDLMPGSDLVIPLARLAVESDIKIALVGSTEHALKKAATALQKTVPGLKVATVIAPPFGFDPEGRDADKILDQVDRSGARLCFVALGAPKQEAFAARGRERTPHVGFASVGAGLDFLAGSQVRAPSWIRQLALEWVWRMMTSPRRLGPRYLRCMLILPGQIIAALKTRLRSA